MSRSASRHVLLTICAALALCTIALTGAARASGLVYECAGSNLCRADAHGGHRRILRDDHGPYDFLSASGTGRWISFLEGGHMWLARPDGTHRRRVDQLATLDPLNDEVLFADPKRGSCTGRLPLPLRPLHCIGISHRAYQAPGLHGQILSVASYDVPYSDVCVTGLHDRCVKRVAWTDWSQGYVFWGRPALSPNGRLLAVDEDTSLHSGTGGMRVVLFDARTGHRIRTLSTADVTGPPVFSPDGHWVTYTRAGRETPRPGPFGDSFPTSIWEARVTGGAPKRLISVGRWGIWLP